MLDFKPVSIASLALAALAAAPASAGLINTPATPVPIINQPPVKRAPPAPPATIHYSEVAGWRIGIGQVAAPDAVCGRPSTFVGIVYPGSNVTWSYHFVRSDGSQSQAVEVPAAPNVPDSRLGGKGVRDIDGPARPGVSDRLLVDANGMSIQTEELALTCHD